MVFLQEPGACAPHLRGAGAAVGFTLPLVRPGSPALSEPPWHLRSDPASVLRDVGLSRDFAASTATHSIRSRRRARGHARGSARPCPSPCARGLTRSGPRRSRNAVAARGRQPREGDPQRRGAYGRRHLSWTLTGSGSGNSADPVRRRTAPGEKHCGGHRAGAEPDRPQAPRTAAAMGSAVVESFVAKQLDLLELERDAEVEERRYGPGGGLSARSCPSRPALLRFRPETRLGPGFVPPVDTGVPTGTLGPWSRSRKPCETVPLGSLTCSSHCTCPRVLPLLCVLWAISCPL